MKSMGLQATDWFRVIPYYISESNHQWIKLPHFLDDHPPKSLRLNHLLTMAHIRHIPSTKEIRQQMWHILKRAWESFDDIHKKTVGVPLQEGFIYWPKLFPGVPYVFPMTRWPATPRLPWLPWLPWSLPQNADTQSDVERNWGISTVHNEWLVSTWHK